MGIIRTLFLAVLVAFLSAAQSVPESSQRADAGPSEQTQTEGTQTAAREGCRSTSPS